MKDVRKMLKLASEMGWEATRTKNGWRLMHPSGATTMVHTSVSDHRAWKNLVCDLRRPNKVSI